MPLFALNLVDIRLDLSHIFPLSPRHVQYCAGFTNCIETALMTFKHLLQMQILNFRFPPTRQPLKVLRFGINNDRHIRITFTHPFRVLKYVVCSVRHMHFVVCTQIELTLLKFDIRWSHARSHRFSIPSRDTIQAKQICIAKCAHANVDFVNCLIFCHCLDSVITPIWSNLNWSKEAFTRNGWMFIWFQAKWHVLLFRRLNGNMLLWLKL